MRRRSVVPGTVTGRVGTRYSVHFDDDDGFLWARASVSIGIDRVCAVVEIKKVHRRNFLLFC